MINEHYELHKRTESLLPIGKMRTSMSTMDINKDGHISNEDYELMGKRLAEHSQMTEEQGEATKKSLQNLQQC